MNYGERTMRTIEHEQVACRMIRGKLALERCRKYASHVSTLGYIALQEEEIIDIESIKSLQTIAEGLNRELTLIERYFEV